MTNDDGQWFVWGDTECLAEDVSEEKAKSMVDQLINQGRTDVYAEDNDSGDVYP